MRLDWDAPVTEVLNPKLPRSKKTGKLMPTRVFGYATRTVYLKRWKAICANAKIMPLTAHSGRHGYYTELRVRQGTDSITAAHAGRWKDAQLPDKIYTHVEIEQSEIRAKFRTKSGQAANAGPDK